MQQTFQVDPRGLTDLLSRHLYGSPGVITVHPSDATEDGIFRIDDTGVGLTEHQIMTAFAVPPQYLAVGRPDRS
jgi:molecular chaperone HtpG